MRSLSQGFSFFPPSSLHVLSGFGTMLHFLFSFPFFFVFVFLNKKNLTEDYSCPTFPRCLQSVYWCPDMIDSTSCSGIFFCFCFKDYYFSVCFVFCHEDRTGVCGTLQASGPDTHSNNKKSTARPQPWPHPSCLISAFWSAMSFGGPQTHPPPYTCTHTHRHPTPPLPLHPALSFFTLVQLGRMGSDVTVMMSWSCDAPKWYWHASVASHWHVRSLHPCARVFWRGALQV